MSWGSGSGVVFLTTLAGGAAALGLAALLIQWLHIPAMEGQSGYFAVFITLAGLAGGFVIGLLVAVTVHAGFWKAEGLALAITVGLAAIAGALALAAHDEGPTLRGDKLLLEVELKCPPGWAPDNYSRSELGSGFRIQKIAATDSPDSQWGGLTFHAAPEFAGQWVVECAIHLTKTRSKPYVNIRVGHKTELTIQLPLPRHPDAKFEQWSAWSMRGFVTAAAPGYEYRFRVERQTEYDAAHPDERAAFLAARAKAIAAVPADAPIAAWLPFFEDQNQRPIATEQCPHPEIEAVNARPAELAPLLRSSDGDVARRAIYAAVTLKTVPASLVEPLAAGARHAVELIQQAKAQSLPGDPDLVGELRAWGYFFYWDSAMERAGTPAIAARRAALDEIQRALTPAGPADGFALIADRIAKDRANLEAPAQ